MARHIRYLLVFAVAALMAGCAGTNFKRPDAGALTTGKSTFADVTRVMGPPEQTGEGLKNGEKLRHLRYVYAEGAGVGRYPGVVPARAMVFSLFNDLVVAQEFVSSFPEDATDFDESKVSAIVTGRSSRADVLRALGNPNGDAIHPVIRNRGEVAILYSYSHAKGSAFNMKFYAKSLLVSFGPDGVVSDVEFSSSGEK